MAPERVSDRVEGPLCAECGRCGWRRRFNADSDVARENLATLSRRLVCSHCGARTPVLHRAADDREARRWYGER